MTTKQTPRPKRLTKKQRLSELSGFVALCFAAIGEEDFKEVSNLTGLSLSTVNRLATGRFSLAVRYGTIQALGYAAGLQLTFNEYSYSVRLVD